MRESVLITDIINNIAEEERGTETEALDDEPFKNAVIEEAAPDAVVEEVVLDVDEEEENTAAERKENPETAVVEEVVEEKETRAVPETGGQASRRSTRIAAGIKKPERYIHASFVERKRWEEQAAKNAIKAEIQQLFKDLKALEPVKVETIMAGACVLTCHMFLVENFFANG
jgi:hypothetical protein